MHDTSTEDRFHTIDEFKAALDFDEAELTYLRRLARNRCQRKRPGEEEDVLHEAIERVLEGRRAWPRGVNLFAFLSGVMRSIVSETSKIGFRRNVDRDIDQVAEVASAATSAEGIVLEKEVQTHVMALFDGDDDAQALVEGLMGDWEKKDLLSLFDDDTTRYETTRKRFRRKVNGVQDLKGMIDGG